MGSAANDADGAGPAASGVRRGAQSSSFWEAAERVAPWAALAGLCAWLFASQFTSGVCMAWRDSGHFYIPLLETVRQQWGEGRIPLWNPYENGGQPLLGDGTSGVFYPGKLIFALPFDFLLLYKIYIVGHVASAYAACYAVARGWGADRGRATLAALSYAFCGNVLFQYCNVIFLVGAAWLPVAWWCGDHLLKTRSPAALLGLGSALAMMVLAGDPQSAYLATAVLGLRAVCFRGSSPAAAASAYPQREPKASTKLNPPATSSKKNSPAKSTTQSAASTSSVGGDRNSSAGGKEKPAKMGWPEHLKASKRAQRAGIVLAAGMWGWMLSAVQILPTQEYSRQSQRAEGPLPRTLASLPGWLTKSEPPIVPDVPNPNWYDGLLGRRTQLDGFHSQIYEFSVGPWRALEYVVPYFGGSHFPINRRWLDCWGGESLMWTPTLYMGLVPLILALAGLAFFRGDERRRWLSWTALVCWVMSWGGYGIGWLVTSSYVGWMAPYDMARNVRDLSVGPEFGGLYWLAVVFAPGWESFRFPAKMLVPAGLALSLLAALPYRSSEAVDEAEAEADAEQASYRRRLLRLTQAAAVLGLLCLAGALAVAPWWNGWLAGAQPDSVSGPLDAAGAWRDLAFGGLTAAILAGGLLFLLPRQAEAVRSGSDASRSPRRAAMWSTLLVGFATLDVGWNNGGMIYSAPDEVCVRDSELGKSIARHFRETAAKEGGDSPAVPARIWRIQDWHPDFFEHASSPRRMGDLVEWERNALVPRHPLSMSKKLGIEIAEMTGTINLFDHVQYFSPALRQNSPGEPPDRVHPRRGLDAWNVRYFVLPTKRPPNAAESSVEGLDRAWTEPRFTPDHPQGAPNGPPLATLEPSPEERKRWPDAVQVVVNDSALPRARVVRKLMQIPPLAEWYGRKRLVWLQAMLFPVLQPLDLREAVLVESDSAEKDQAIGFPAPVEPPAEPEVRVASYTPTEVVLDCNLVTPGVVVLADSYDSNWEATVEANGKVEPVETLRANRIMRAVLVAAGPQKLVFRYVPTAFYFGAALSLPGWLVTIVLGLCAWLAPARFRSWVGEDGGSAEGAGASAG